MSDWTTVNHAPGSPARGRCIITESSDAAEQGTVGCRSSLAIDLRLNRGLLDSTGVARRDWRGWRTPAHRT